MLTKEKITRNAYLVLSTEVALMMEHEGPNDDDVLHFCCQEATTGGSDESDDDDDGLDELTREVSVLH